MDDYSISTLTESNNEWCARLVHILTPLIIDGIRSIFDEAFKLCKDNNELDKYLMTFQNFITRIPKWNQTLIQEETNRICQKSNCGYLEDLVTCVHIIKLKSLTCIRVGEKQKKVDINVPVLSEFIHKIYINVARKLYSNVYLFERNIAPLKIQKNNRELELIVKESILLTIRDSIPVESILRAYMDETQETAVEIEEKEELIEQEIINPQTEKSLSESGNNENLKNKQIINLDVKETTNNEFNRGNIEENKQISNVKFNEKLNTIKEFDNIKNTLDELIDNGSNNNFDNNSEISLDFSTNNSPLSSPISTKLKINDENSIIEPLDLDIDLGLDESKNETSDVELEFDEL
jgi:hypothetical protein